MDAVFRECGECGNSFLVEFDSDWMCDACSNKLFNQPHHMSRKELESRNWDDRKIKKQWQKSYKESEARILSKCEGTNYGCK